MNKLFEHNMFVICDERCGAALFLCNLLRGCHNFWTVIILTCDIIIMIGVLRRSTVASRVWEIEFGSGSSRELLLRIASYLVPRGSCYGTPQTSKMIVDTGSSVSWVWRVCDE